ncbi:MAG: ABC transporter permease [Tannerella sp.]|jgi:putative ABC transport system permease protein|nr:ABC transporter permease [Tannerella sp.]
MWKTALDFMVYERSKLAGILLGIVISMFLAGIQLALVDKFLEDSTGFLRGNHEYVYVIDRKSPSSASLLNVDNRVGYELRSIPGVDKVFPVVVSGGTCRFASGSTANVCIVGVQYPEMAGAPKRYTTNTRLAALQNDGAIIIDEDDQSNFEDADIGSYFYLNNNRVTVSGVSQGNDALGVPYIVTTVERARQLTGFNAGQASAFLLKCTNQEAVIAQINRTVPNVKACSGEEFVNATKTYNKKTNGILGSIYLMMTFALVAGVIIVGLTMFSSVNDRIRDYGTVKAIGGSNRIILKLILRQAVLYTVIGFLLTAALLAASKSLLGVNLSAGLLLILFSTTLIMSLAGSFFCLRKIFKLEPVQIFRM